MVNLQKKTLCIFGATGNLGKICQKILLENIKCYNLQAFSFFNDLDNAFQILIKFKTVRYVICPKTNFWKQLKTHFPNIQIFSSFQEYFSFCKKEQIFFDYIVNLLGTYIGYYISYESIDFCSNLLLANKESLVMAGEFIINKIKKTSCKILPIDSEHFALNQLLLKHKNNFQKLILPCTGGLLWKQNLCLNEVTLQKIMDNHVWRMGQHITVNSTTLMNKCFELIETHFLFNIDLRNVLVILHPNGIVHGGLILNNNEVVFYLEKPNMKHIFEHYFVDDKSPCFKNFDISLQAIMFENINKHPLVTNLDFAYSTINKNVDRIILNVINDLLVKDFLIRKIDFLQLNTKLNILFKKYQKHFIDYQINNLNDIEGLIKELESIII